MSKALQRAILGGAILLFALGGNTVAMAESSDSACTREGLKSITDEYFTALEAHKPSSLPLAPNVRYTENGIEVPIGKGVWETACKTIFKRGMLDTRKCGTHTQSVIEEKDNPNPMLYGVRLKIDKEKISEIEAIVIRGEQVLDVPAILATKDQDWEDILPPEQRSSRLAMMAAADDYFELFVKEKKRKVSDLAYSGFCNRWENGAMTTKGGMNQDIPMPRHDCSPEGFADMTETHGPRRFLVDEETGVVVAYVLFNNMWPDFHMFRMNNGRVVWIQAYFEYGKEYKTMGWPDEPACK
ncbi:MAG: hypothetical protein JW896_18575 [Deltaproteobacteria bacterium]|nr:hypothetical protein [Deltaproteobacteria bacterium]